MDPAKEKKKKKVRRSSSRKTLVAEDEDDTKKVRRSSSRRALLAKNDSAACLKKEGVKKTKSKDKSSSKRRAQRRHSVGGLGDALQQLQQQQEQTHNVLAMVEADLHTVADLSVATFQPLEATEEPDMHVDIHRGTTNTAPKSSSRKPQRESRSDRVSNTTTPSKINKTKPQRRQTTGVINNHRLETLFQCAAANVKTVTADDIHSVADVSVESFHPVQNPGIDVLTLGSGKKTQRNKQPTRRTSILEEDEEDDEEEEDPLSTVRKERKNGSTKKKRISGSKSAGPSALEKRLSAKFHINTVSADDLQSVADLSIGTFRPLDDDGGPTLLSVLNRK